MPVNKSSSLLSISSVLLILPFFLWGTAMVAMKGTIPHTTPLFMAGIRLVPAGVLVLITAALMGRAQPKSWQAWAWIGLFGLVDGTLFQGFLAEGLVRTSAGLGSVTIDSQPIAVALLSAWLFKERIGVIGAVGLILGVIGISFVGLPASWWTGVGDIDGGGILAGGQWLMFLAALSMAVGTILIRYVTRYVDPIVATGWHMIIGGIPLFLGSGMWEIDRTVAMTGGDWLSLAYATVFGSAISYGLFFYFAARGNLTSLSALTFLTPVFALLFGNIFLAETLTPWQWLGVSLTLVGICAIEGRDSIWRKLTGKIDLPDTSPAPLSVSPSSVVDRLVGDSPSVGSAAVGVKVTNNES
jgi:drug/metabolite transporter (DMT)-like permease